MHFAMFQPRATPQKERRGNKRQTRSPTSPNNPIPFPPPSLPTGTKKNPKIYGVCCHPLRPQYLLAATNTGTALLMVETLPALAVAPLPLRSPQHAHVPHPDGTAFGEAIGSGATYVVAVGDGLHCVTAATLQQQVILNTFKSKVDIQLIN